VGRFASDFHSMPVLYMQTGMPYIRLSSLGDLVCPCTWLKGREGVLGGLDGCDGECFNVT
jgi:hypothetical protein